MELGEKNDGIFMFGFGPTTACMITNYELIEQVLG
jgi:hypothetical protein